MPIINIDKEVFHCDSCDYSTTSSLYFDRHLRGEWHKKGKGPLFTFSCKTCNFRTNSKGNYTRHCTAKSHIEKEKGIEQKKANDFFCSYCVYGTSDKSNYERHIKSERHKKNAYSGIIYYAKSAEFILGQELN